MLDIDFALKQVVPVKVFQAKLLAIKRKNLPVIREL
jgi:hypothetical protein